MRIQSLWKGLLIGGLGSLICMAGYSNTEIPALYASEVSVQDNFNCDRSDCTLTVVYDKSKGSLYDQINTNLNLISEDVSAKPIKQFYIFPSTNNDVLSHTEWIQVRDAFLKQYKYTNPVNHKVYRNEISYLYMKGLVMEHDSLPDEAFSGAESFNKLELPKITTLTKDALKGVTFQDLYLPVSLTSVDVDAFPVNDKGYLPPTQYIHVAGDLAAISSSLEKVKHTGLYLDTTNLSNENMPLLKNTSIEQITFEEGQKKINVNLNTWFDLDAEHAKSASKLGVNSFVDTIKSFTAEGFTNLTRVSFSNSATVEEVRIKKCGITSIGNMFKKTTALSILDLSENQIDFSEKGNAAFYAENAAKPNFNLHNQRPDLKIDTMADVKLQVGDPLPTIQPVYLYADKTIVDFANPLPWMDAAYASTYEAAVTYNDSPALDLNTANTYTRTYVSPNGTSIGTVKIVVSEASTSKEAPNIALTSNPASEITSDTELTFTAMMKKTGSADLNANATVTFYDGSVSLGTVNMSDDKGILEKQKLSQGSHTIKAVYSGNSDFQSVETLLQIEVTAPPDPNKQAQSLQFAKDHVVKTYGDSNFQNPYTKSETASTGGITFISSDPSIASVNEKNGEVTIHKAGTATITVRIKEDAVYQAAQTSYTIEVEKKAVLLQDIKIKDKIYDGSTKAEIIGSPSLIGSLPEDAGSLSVVTGIAEFSDAFAGTQKQVLLKEFTLQGSAKENYTLQLPTISATIKQKEAQICVENAQRQVGEENPSFTYTIAGLIETDTKETLLDFVEPLVSSSAKLDSEAGSYAITASGASSRNYIFTYQEGILSITGKATITSADYTITGTKGKNDWYVSDVVITPKNGFTQIWDGVEWKDALTFQNGEHEHLTFKLRKSDGSETEAFMIDTLRIDTMAPTAVNIKDGDTYLLNRLIRIPSEDVVRVMMDDIVYEDITNDIELVIKDSATHKIVIEDRAGNISTYIYQTKTLEEYAKTINALTSETVQASDYESVLKFQTEVEALLKDTSYSPSAQQKTQLEELREHCSDLLAALTSSKDTVNTGDTTTQPWCLFLLILSTGVIFYLLRRRQIDRKCL